jgi:hypothetical protein
MKIENTSKYCKKYSKKSSEVKIKRIIIRIKKDFGKLSRIAI